MTKDTKGWLFVTSDFGYGITSRYFRWWWLTLFITAVMAVVVGGALWLGVAVGRRECRVFSEQTRLETTYRPFAGCYLELKDGTSAPVDEDSIGLILRELLEEN